MNRPWLRLAFLFALALPVGCGWRDRDKVFDGGRADESETKGLVRGHVHLFELVQWGPPAGGVTADKLAERDATKLALAQRNVELLELKIERGVMEVPDLVIIRVVYELGDWEKQKSTVRRPPNGKIEPTTTMVASQPDRPTHQVPAVLVERYQDRMPKEVVKTPEEARAFWAQKLDEARRLLATVQEEVRQAKATADAATSLAQRAAPVEKTKVRFALLPLPSGVMFTPPRDPRGYWVDPKQSRRRKSFMLNSLGSVTPEPPAFADRAALEKGVELATAVTIHGLDSGEGLEVAPKEGKLVLKLVGRYPVQVFRVKEEVTENRASMIQIIPKSVGFADWYEIPYPTSEGEQALGTTIIDLLTNVSSKNSSALDAELASLKYSLKSVIYEVDRIRGMKPPNPSGVSAP